MAGKCAGWLDKGRKLHDCQFDEEASAHIWNNTTYCRFHFPMAGSGQGAKADWNDNQKKAISDAIIDRIKAELSGPKDQSQPLDFSGVVVPGRLDFGKEATCSISFHAAQFHGYVVFSSAEFLRDVWFDQAQFHRDTWFSKAQFYGVAGFNEAEFHEAIEFSETQFHGEARFNEAQFFKVAEFGKTQFFQDAEFGKTLFRNFAKFEEVQFHKHAEFGEAQFLSDTYFNKSVQWLCRIPRSRFPRTYRVLQGAVPPVCTILRGAVP